MSVAGYLGAGKTEVRMPKGVDQLGIRFEGVVLTGERTVEEQLNGEVPPMWSGDEYYQGVDDYDPVLRAHCGR